eukprot:jgi/Antlo1/143/1172
MYFVTHLSWTVCGVFVDRMTVLNPHVCRFHKMKLEKWW